MRVDFHIPYVVQPKQSCRGGRKGWYQTDKIKTNAECLASFVRPHRPARMLHGPLRTLYIVRYPYRKSEPKKNRNGCLPKDTAPDFEQLAKQLGDVLESCGFFANDAQIYDARVVKLWDARPDVHIVIEENPTVSWVLERLNDEGETEDRYSLDDDESSRELVVAFGVGFAAPGVLWSRVCNTQNSRARSPGDGQETSLDDHEDGARTMKAILYIAPTDYGGSKWGWNIDFGDECYVGSGKVYKTSNSAKRAAVRIATKLGLTITKVERE